MATYTLTRYSHGVELESVTLHRRDAVARRVKNAATAALLGMGKAEAIGGNYGEATHPDSYASRFWRDSIVLAGLVRGGMMPGAMREVVYGPHHTHQRAPYEHPAARIEIMRES